ncbi:MAG: hypothetical protein CBD46_001905 [Gammaproteobacteria bacterium TMED186]|nr:MAG: hypothetical protein CBD46_001905 [Gammaproteobacteria bacterium TMED186]
MKILNLQFIFLTTIFLSGCGGGGGSSSNNAPEPPIQNPYNLTCSSYQSNTQKCNLTHNNIIREYYIYIPSSYTPSSNASLMFVLHGYGSSATNIMFYSSFQNLAEEDSYIIVYPQGSLLNGVTHWNVGGWTIGSTANDVDFIETIIELVDNEYFINNERIYSTGMSNGGYMSYHLACNTNLFAAVASVTGSMTPETYNNCSPTNATSILQIHGLQDFTVPYTGAPWSKTIPEVMEYWSEYNNCNEDPLSSITDLSDGSYIYFDSYQNCSNTVGVNLILHSTMGHTWPSINNHSMSATAEVWLFFKDYDLNGKID